MILSNKPLLIAQSLCNERKLALRAHTAALVPFLVLLDPQSFLFERIFEFIVRRGHELLAVCRLTIESTKARSQVAIVTFVGLG